MELTETIIANRLPEFFESSYHHKHIGNFMRCNLLFWMTSERDMSMNLNTRIIPIVL
jgi:hypothetical protein